jgi:hypothetical protein
MTATRPRKIIWKGGWGTKQIRYIVNTQGWHRFQIKTAKGWEEGHDTEMLGVIEEAMAPILHAQNRETRTTS